MSITGTSTATREKSQQKMLSTTFLLKRMFTHLYNWAQSKMRIAAAFRCRWETIMSITGTSTATREKSQQKMLSTTFLFPGWEGGLKLQANEPKHYEV